MNDRERIVLAIDILRGRIAELTLRIRELESFEIFGVDNPVLEDAIDAARQRREALNEDVENELRALEG